MVLLYGALQISTTRAVSYKTTWWKAGDSYDANHCGTLVYDHPVTRAMAPDGWCDDGLVLPGRRRQQVRSGKDAGQALRDHPLPSMALIEDDALLYEVGVGRGTLIVSGLNHMRAKGRPENQWLMVLDRSRRRSPAAQAPMAGLVPVGRAVGPRRLCARLPPSGIQRRRGHFLGSHPEDGARSPSAGRRNSDTGLSGTRWSCPRITRGSG